jgi:4'-phosphopantetheinyl transferase
MQLFAVDVSEDIDEPLFRTLMGMVSDNKRSRLGKFRKREDARRTLVGDLLIRAVIMEQLELRNRDIAFETNEFGKPVLTHHAYFHFNVSHSGDWVVCAVDAHPVGIDVEQVNPISLSVADRVLTPGERQELNRLPEQTRLGGFFDFWTLKESYVKAVGRGLNQPLQSFSVTLENIGSVIQVEGGAEQEAWYCKCYPFAHNYKLSVCAAHRQFSERIVTRELLGLADRFMNE